MIDIIFSNVGLWFNLLIPFGIGLYLVLNHKDYVLKEFAIQVVGTLVFLFLMYLLLFSTTTDLVDREYYNGKVSKFEYYEEWTEEVTYYDEECSGSGDNRSCTTVTKTRDEYHSPYWQIVTSNGEVLSISKSKFRKARSEFGAKFKNIFRSDQVSFGDGDKYISTPNKVIPTSVSHTYTNLIVASKDNVINEQVSIEELNIFLKDNSLRKYPNSYRGSYGETKLRRIIDTTGFANQTDLLTKLDHSSSSLGAYKEANPIVYITDKDRDFKRILDGYWEGGEKNDITLILGIDKKTKKIIWSDVITYTDNTDFIINLQNNFKDMNISDSKGIISKFNSHIAKGYKRKPMEDFDYLKENITLEWYWQLLVLIGNLILSFFLFMILLEKEIPNPFKRFTKNGRRSKFNSRGRRFR